jgi:two-component system sensor histidine kinase RegB
MEMPDFGHEARRVRVGTLVRLRWIAAAGQIAALAVSRFALHLEFPFAASAICVALLIAFNGYLRFGLPQAKRLDERTTTYILAFDIGQLGVMLYLTGGLANPFAMLLLAPTMISAVSQSWDETAKLLAFAIVCAGALALWSEPLKQHGAVYVNPPPIETIGFLLAIAISAVFIAVNGSQVAKEARQLAEALAATELMLARAQHLSQLDGLAAAAAHELGTPLATLTVVIHELANQKDVVALCGEDLALARQELKRCRTILGQLANASRMAVEPFDRVEIDALLEEVAGPHRLQGIEIAVSAEGRGPHPTCPRNPALIYGLRNLVENAMAFASAEVRIAANWTEERVDIAVLDDGPGFPPAILSGLGEPFISDRAAARRSDPETAGGLGLGLFISKALLERTGAELRIANRVMPYHGAVATISWPRREFGTEARAAFGRIDSIQALKPSNP